MNNGINKILILSVMPDRTILPEWEDSPKKLSDKATGIQSAIYSSFTGKPGDRLFHLGLYEQHDELSPSIDYFLRFFRLFIHKLSRIPELETLRHRAVVAISDYELDQFAESIPMIIGAEYINRDMLNELWAGLGETFSEQIREYDGTLESFFHAKNPSVHLAGRVFFHLVENKNSDLPFAFMATYSAGMGRNGKPTHLPLKHAIKEYDDNDLLKLLSTVYAAAEKSKLVESLIETGELFHPLAWGADEAFCFLKEIHFYEEAGVLCRIPDWWKQNSQGARLNISFGDKKPSFVGMDALVNFNASLLMGDTIVSEEDARRMLEESEGLAFIKNKWVPVDHEKLKLALEACDKVKQMADEGLPLREAIRLQLNPDKMFDKAVEGIELSVSNGSWLESVIDKLRQPDLVSDVKPGKGFQAELREYQKKGLTWLYYLDSLNFGACLADDMGLGKTIQVLAFLSTLKKKEGLSANLLIVPASLISNWTSEIEKFFPGLIVHVAHPGFASSIGKKKAGFIIKETVHKNKDELNTFDLVITSYALAQRYEWLGDYHWNYVILDEAQAIKNPGTKQTRAVKKLKSCNRIIMTGTPVENRISDLWSLFDFLNPGLLGNMKEFSAFSKKLSSRPEGYSRLRKIVSPYILRRLKTDKSVISDLPDKVEMKSFADLSRKQIVLYRKSVEELEKSIETSEGIQRKGLVLSSLMKFKQLCNHPDQFTGTGEYKESESGKFQRLRQICETIYEKRERVLVFTQFKEVTEPIRAFLETIFNHKGLVLHGSVPVGKRKKIVETFQDEIYCPFMVLSLKAGGVGLNLTKANHVVHFDRWWNPAVENQATDRAFRIGQHKNVIVHKFVTRGTIEEKIDMMLEAKKELADQVVSNSGETLITEMDNTRLMNLFRLTL
ncbi:ATP-dependent helicase HepA [bacterium BMS3Bbin09]|nr:ATP-dependent helicase HepA [bacterium BMS3Bbin09]HDO22046.1 DEAD/DEAH box helicase [Nitrospirota bacterium]